MKRKASVLLAAMLLLTVFVLPSAQVGAASTRPRTAAVEELEAANTTRSGYPAMTKVVDGDLYVWGSNGTTSAIGVSGQSKIITPYKLDRSLFGGEAIVMAQVADWCTAALTETGRVYLAAMDKWNLVTFDFDGATPVSITAGRHGLVVKAMKNGAVSWWSVWADTGVEKDSWKRVDNDGLKAGMKAATGRDEIIQDLYYYSRVDFYVALTESGEVFTWGNNLLGNIGNNWGQVDDSITEPRPEGTIPTVPESTPYHVTGRPEFAGRTIKQLSMYYSTVTVLDDRGTVWTWGSGSSGKIGNGTTQTETPYQAGSADTAKPYPAFGPGSENKPGEKAHYIMTTSQNLMAVLTTDNKLFAWGESTKYLAEDKVAHYRAVEIFNTITTQETVVQVNGPTTSTFITCLSGNTYFAGDAWLSGTGQESGTITTPGKVEQENVPPQKPQSANKIFMTIKTTDDEGAPVEYSTAAGNIGDLSIRVGQQFTLNVYFEDFAQLTAFYVPISFDPNLLKVSDLEGRVYDTTGGPVRPGFGDKSGIRTKLGIGENDPTKINTTWINGVLTDNSSLPMVDNDSGYVLVEGLAKLENGVVNRITGQVQMFSIEFKAVNPTTGNETTGFHIDGNEADPLFRGAPGKWFSSKLDYGTVEGVDKVNAWSFEDQDFFPTKLHEVQIEDMDMNLYRDEDSLVTDKASDGEGQPEYYRIDKRNTDSDYKVKAEVRPSNASWPDIDRWECKFQDGSTPPASAVVSDYITVLANDHPTYFEFMISSGITSNPNVLDESGAFVPAYIEITGYGSHIPNKNGQPEGSRKVIVKVTDDVPAPTKISITNKDKFLTDQGGKIQVNAASKEEFPGISLDDTFTFAAGFEAANMDDFGKDVKWQLLKVTEWETDESGAKTPKSVEALGTDAKAPVVIVPDSAAGDPLKPTCKIQAQTSTADDEDIILKVSSSVDPSIYDYVAVKVRLAPYDIILPSDSITLVYGTGLKQTYSLSDNAKVVPGSAVDYTLEYLKTVEVTDNRTDLELNGETKRTSPNIIVKDDGTIEPVRSDKEFSANSYDTVTLRIQQTLGGTDKTLTKKLKVYTVDAVPPENMFVDVRNNAGVTSDYIKFSIGDKKSQLEVGDTLKLYRDYADADPVYTYDSLTQQQIDVLMDPGYNVPSRTVGNQTYALNPAGGTVGYQLIKADGTSYKKTPVMYNPKALKLSGFIKVYGKAQTKTAHDGITITINDVVGSDGKSISTTTKADGVLHGYFEFEEYISAKEHTMTISKTNYLSRQVKFTMSATEDYEISTAETPIQLYPGDLDGKRGIQYDDLNEYRTNWAGKYKTKGVNQALLENFNFIDADGETETVINVHDLLAVNIRMGMTTADYSPWLMD